MAIEFRPLEEEDEAAEIFVRTVLAEIRDDFARRLASGEVQP
jgi:hypothetical protein